MDFYRENSRLIPAAHPPQRISSQNSAIALIFFGCGTSIYSWNMIDLFLQKKWGETNVDLLKYDWLSDSLKIRAERARFLAYLSKIGHLSIQRIPQSRFTDHFQNVDFQKQYSIAALQGSLPGYTRAANNTR